MIETDLIIYTSRSRGTPFLEWLESLSNPKTAAVIKARLNRIRLGNFGDCKSIGSGIYELRIHYDKGYRIYFGKESNVVIVLLCAGDKSSQKRDIVKARLFWKEYKDAGKKL